MSEIENRRRTKSEKSEVDGLLRTSYVRSLSDCSKVDRLKSDSWRKENKIPSSYTSQLSRSTSVIGSEGSNDHVECFTPVDGHFMPMFDMTDDVSEDHDIKRFVTCTKSKWVFAKLCPPVSFFFF